MVAGPHRAHSNLSSQVLRLSLRLWGLIALGQTELWQQLEGAWEVAGLALLTQSLPTPTLGGPQQRRST